MEYGCAVCLKYFDADYNQLVECPICELKVHQSCFGLLELPPYRKWYCNKCTMQPRKKKLKCELCPITVGAFKPCQDSRTGFVHVMCALCIPGVNFVDNMNMDSVSIDDAPQNSDTEPCVICLCNERESEATDGVRVPCSMIRCGAHVHVACAAEKNLLNMPTSIFCRPDRNIAMLMKMSSEEREKYFDDDINYKYFIFCTSTHKEKFEEKKGRSPAFPGPSGAPSSSDMGSDKAQQSGRRSATSSASKQVSGRRTSGKSTDALSSCTLRPERRITRQQAILNRRSEVALVQDSLRSKLNNPVRRQTISTSKPAPVAAEFKLADLRDDQKYKEMPILPNSSNVQAFMDSGDAKPTETGDRCHLPPQRDSKSETLSRAKTLDELLESKWIIESANMMEKAGRFDVAHILTILHTLRMESKAYEEKMLELQARKAHLKDVNSRLSKYLCGLGSPSPEVSIEALYSTSRSRNVTHLHSQTAAHTCPDISYAHRVPSRQSELVRRHMQPVQQHGRTPVNVALLRQTNLTATSHSPLSRVAHSECLHKVCSRELLEASLDSTSFAQGSITSFNCEAPTFNISVEDFADHMLTEPLSSNNVSGTLQCSITEDMLTDNMETGEVLGS